MGRVVWLSLIGVSVGFLLLGIAIGDAVGKHAATASLTPTTTLASQAPSASAASTTTAPLKHRTATIGTSWTLSFTDVDTNLPEKIDVTLVAVKDPAQPDNSFDAPPSNQRLVAVELRLKDVGHSSYQ